MNDVFVKYDSVALGGAIGVMVGFAVFLATGILLVQGGGNVGETLALMGNYFAGYDVTWAGSIIGSLWGYAFGFVIGFVTAVAINVTVSIHFGKLLRRLGVPEGTLGLFYGALSGAVAGFVLSSIYNLIVAFRIR